MICLCFRRLGISSVSIYFVHILHSGLDIVEAHFFIRTACIPCGPAAVYVFICRMAVSMSASLNSTSLNYDYEGGGVRSHWFIISGGGSLNVDT